MIIDDDDYVKINWWYDYYVKYCSVNVVWIYGEMVSIKNWLDIL